MVTWGDQTCQRFEATAVGFETKFSRLRVQHSNQYAIVPHSVQVVTQFRWSLSSSGHSVQVVTQFRWSLSSGGHSVQVVTQFRWSLSSGGHSVQVVTPGQLCGTFTESLSLLITHLINVFLLY